LKLSNELESMKQSLSQKSQIEQKLATEGLCLKESNEQCKKMINILEQDKVLYDYILQKHVC
jgi:hypothetical protein